MYSDVELYTKGSEATPRRSGPYPGVYNDVEFVCMCAVRVLCRVRNNIPLELATSAAMESFKRNLQTCCFLQGGLRENLFSAVT